MKFIPWLALAGSLFVWSCSDQAAYSRAMELLEESRQQFCPDKRVCIWDVELSQKMPFILSGSTTIPAAKAQLLQKLNEAGFTFIDSIHVLPSAELEGKLFGLVCVSVCNIRTEPRHASELATQAAIGTPLQVYEQRGDWFRVQTPDQYIGWLDLGGFTRCDSAAWEQWHRAEKLIVTRELALAYQAPDPESPTISDLVGGGLLTLLESKGLFYKAGFPDGRIGYLRATDVEPFSQWVANTTPEPGAILRSAFALMGRPYLWGGTSVKGMDCSGFTKTVFFQNGLLLPRDASQQVRVGDDVHTDTTFSQLRPGDLLFFGRKATEDLPEKITHVAIYVDSGQFIHASSRVKVESLWPDDLNYSAYRRSTFVKAKRLLSPHLDSTLLLRNQPGYNAK